MRAVIQTGYGSADVIELRELEKPPAPADGAGARARERRQPRRG